MQVGLVTGKGRVDLVEMPEPEPEPDKAVVQIDYCGICGTDVHAYISGEPYNPAICGHEWTGRVSAAGPGVVNVKEGDRVAIGIASACGQCPSLPARRCRPLRNRLCRRHRCRSTGRAPGRLRQRHRLRSRPTLSGTGHLEQGRRRHAGTGDRRKCTRCAVRTSGSATVP